MPPAKRRTARKTAAKKTTARKPAKRRVAKKTTARKPAKRRTVKKAAAKKAPAKRRTAKKAAKRRTAQEGDRKRGGEEGRSDAHGQEGHAEAGSEEGCRDAHGQEGHARSGPRRRPRSHANGARRLRRSAGPRRRLRRRSAHRRSAGPRKKADEARTGEAPGDEAPLVTAPPSDRRGPPGPLRRVRCGTGQSSVMSLNGSPPAASISLADAMRRTRRVAPSASAPVARRCPWSIATGSGGRAARRPWRRPRRRRPVRRGRRPALRTAGACDGRCGVPASGKKCGSRAATMPSITSCPAWRWSGCSRYCFHGSWPSTTSGRTGAHHLAHASARARRRLPARRRPRRGSAPPRHRGSGRAARCSSWRVATSAAGSAPGPTCPSSRR